MKTWTVVVEITDGRPDLGFMSTKEIEQLVSRCMESEISPNACISFQIYEVTEAPYGPSGVTLVPTRGPQYTLGKAGRVETAVTCDPNCKLKEMWSPDLRTTPIKCKNCAYPLDKHSPMRLGLKCPTTAVQS